MNMMIIGYVSARSLCFSIAAGSLSGAFWAAAMGVVFLCNSEYYYLFNSCVDNMNSVKAIIISYILYLVIFFVSFMAVGVPAFLASRFFNIRSGVFGPIFGFFLGILAGFGFGMPHGIGEWILDCGVFGFSGAVAAIVFLYSVTACQRSKFPEG